MEIWPWEILSLEFDPDEDTGAETQDDEIIEDSGQKAEDRMQRTDGRGQNAEGRGQRTECRGQNAEGSGQRTECRGQKADDRGKIKTFDRIGRIFFPQAPCGA